MEREQYEGIKDQTLQLSRNTIVQKQLNSFTKMIVEKGCIDSVLNRILASLNV